ncbi:MAG: NosD domain-containing protein [Candidatus Thorarchaeota archaeon]
MKSSKVSSYVITVGFTLIMLFSSILIPSTELVSSVNSVSEYGTNFQLAYTDHAPIDITANAEFTIHGFLGNGSSTNPYLIENYNITTPSNCIAISDTSAHFIIQNCLLTGGAGGQGVSMTNVANGIIRNNHIVSKRNPLRIISSSGNTIENNTISNSTAPLLIETSSNNELVNNTISGTMERSVFLYHSSNIILMNNTITGHVLYESIFLYRSPYNSFSGNIMANHGFGLDGFNNLDDWNQNITIDNTVHGKPVGYFWNLTGVTIEGGNYGQLILANCSKISMENTFYNSNFWGIILGYSSHCTMKNITFSENTQGSILLESSINNTIMNCKLSGSSVVGLLLRTLSSDNTITNNSIIGYTRGVYFDYSTNNTLVNNTISENQEYGVNLFDADYTTLVNNTISENGYGINLNNPWEGYCKVVNNTISDNEHWGIVISSNHDTVVNNTISGSEVGISISASYTSVVNNTISGIEYGIRCSSGTRANLIYLNHFIDNSGLEARDDGTGNNWNTTGHGNYWSDYSGTGPYYISGSAGSIDYHPYGYTESVLPEINHPNDIEYDEGTVGNNIMWSPTDVHASHYVLYQNSSEVNVGDWDGGNITIDIDGLDPGVYNYTILVYDYYSNWASDDVIVTVIAGTIDTDGALALVEVLLIGGGVGVVLVVLVMIRKRR